MISTPPPPLDMVLDGLPLGFLGVVLGSGGVGKSMMMLAAAHAVATGVDTLGCLLSNQRVTPHGRVVYLAGEDDELIIHHRIHAFTRDLDEDEGAVMDERVDIIPLVGCAPSLLDNNGEINDDALAWLDEAAVGTRLLIIDPLRQFHRADENDNGAMTTISKALAKIANERRCSIVLVHHVSKAGAKDNDADAAISRGATAITDNARWVMALRKLSDTTMDDLGLLQPAWKYVMARRVKANYTELGDATILERGKGGVLTPAALRPQKSALERMMESLGGTVEEAAVQAERGYEDRDLFG